MSDVEPLIRERKVGGRAIDPQLYLFIASPNGVPPFHVDRYTTFLMQFRGSKKLSVFPQRDERVVSPTHQEGTTLAMTMTDSKTKASFSHSWNMAIPSTVGGSKAYVGFTGSTGYFFANQDIESWTYSTTAAHSAAVPAAPINLRVN